MRLTARQPDGPEHPRFSFVAITLAIVASIGSGPATGSGAGEEVTAQMYFSLRTETERVKKPLPSVIERESTVMKRAKGKNIVDLGRIFNKCEFLGLKM